MKHEERKLARKLRQENGFSINEICRKLGVSKSSVSLWIRDINLTPIQSQNLFKRSVNAEVIEKRRLTRLSKENARRQIVIDGSRGEIRKISNNELFLIGIALYWAEGSKTRRGIVEFSNSDPRLIEIMMKFFKEICSVPSEKFRGHIHLHEHLSIKNAEKYWSKISKISVQQFFKTSNQHNKASKNKKDSLPFGTFSIYVCSTELFLKIKGWMEGLYLRLIGRLDLKL